MPTTISTTWVPGRDLPYVVSIGRENMLAISFPAAWVKAGKDGEPLLLPPAVRALDRLRATFAEEAKPTPGFIVSLRQALGLSQEEFGRRLGVCKMTISRWECCRMRPAANATAAIRALQAQARRAGVKISGGRR